jgi:thioredoxin 1
MFSRRALIVAAVFCGLSAGAVAAEKHDFTPQAFAAAQTAGQPILVEIHAPWCPTCKAQQPILDRLEAEPQFKDLQAFRIDFDSQKDAMKHVKATSQSTLIVYKGEKEMGRSVGETDAAAIEALLKKAL